MVVDDYDDVMREREVDMQNRKKNGELRIVSPCGEESARFCSPTRNPHLNHRHHHPRRQQGLQQQGGLLLLIVALTLLLLLLLLLVVVVAVRRRTVGLAGRRGCHPCGQL
jgi:hypothetical protein